MSIADRSTTCLARFEALHGSGIEDERGRFRVWVGTSSAHHTDRRSLQYRLRDSSDLRNIVIDLLADLLGVLEQLERAAQQDTQERHTESSTTSSLRANSSAATLLDDCGTESSTGQEDISLIDISSQLIGEAHVIISCLFRLSVTFRNPARRDLGKQASATRLEYFEPYDVSYVEEKYPDAPAFLQSRVGKAITRHRQYVKYREDHHSKLSAGLDVAPGDQTDRSSTFATSLPERNHLSQSIALDDTTSEYTATSFASSVTGDSTLRPPPMPEAGHDGEPFRCPLCYCFIVADDHRSWRYEYDAVFRYQYLALTT